MRQIIALAAVLASSTANAQYTDGTIKIGVLTDMSSLYADIGGSGAVAAAKLAVEDFGPAAKGIKIEIVGADHQNKPDVGSNIVNTWFDVEKVDVILEVVNSGVALAVSEIARQKNKLFLATGPATSDLTGSKCNANTIHWVYDTWALAHGTGKAMVKSGGDSWFFLTSDYAFGYALERDTAAVVEANGGKVLGKVRHPINNNDFSSFLLQAQASKAKVIGLANAGGDTMNSIKQAAEFGIGDGGLGLGLAIVDRLCRLLDHPLEMSSVMGKGARFSVVVSLAAASPSRPVGDKSAAPPRRELTPTEGSDRGRSLLVVVMDDDALVLESLGGLLGQWGCRVVAARSPHSILAQVAGEERPDLIISDYRLGDGYSGITAIEALRGSFGAPIPAFLITGDTVPERLREAQESGHYLLHKPVRPMKLRAMLSQLLRSHSVAGAA
jgi:CheY-like chemotaxis protein